MFPLSGLKGLLPRNNSTSEGIIMRNLKKLVVIFLVAAVSVMALSLTALAQDSIAYGAATINASTLNIRKGAGLTYQIIGGVKSDSTVVILERTNDSWYKINHHGTTGYVCTDYLTDILTAENFSAVGIVTDSNVRMRSTYSTNGEILGLFQRDTEMTVIGINSGWYKVQYDGLIGYIRSDLFKITGGPQKIAPTVSTVCSSSSEIGDQVANFALQYLGYDYVYGANSPSTGFDCSGLTSYVFKQFGYSISRTASQQYRTAGSTISKSELAVGDLVFFSSNGSSVTHVGIYIGNNQFVHASTSDTGVIISSLTSAYYTRVWYGAKRVV